MLREASMTPLRAVICVILFIPLMLGINYLFHSVIENYGFLAFGGTFLVILGTMLGLGKLIGVDFS
jgi:hypothetical protein